MKPQVSILIVEPSEIIVEGLKSLLNEAGGFNVLAPLHDAGKLAIRITSQRPDLLVINPTLLAQPISVSLASLQRQCAQIPIVALLYQYVEQRALQGFAAVIDIRESRSRVVAALNDCCNLKASEEETESYDLTERETDVLVLLAQGLSSKEIADRLNISIHTVNTHRKNITHKTGIKSVAGLAVYATLHNYNV